MTGKEMNIAELNIAQAHNATAIISLTDSERAKLEACEGYHKPDNIEAINIYPLRRVFNDQPGGALIGVTELCGHCGGTHVFGLSADPLRILHGQTFALRWQAEPVPEDLRFAIEHEPEDALFWAERLAPRDVSYSAKMLGLRDSSDTLRKRGSFARRQFQDAVQTLVDSGIFDDRCARLTADAPDQVGPVYRRLVAAFIRRQPGGSMRARLSRALTAATKLCARGDFA